MAKPKSHQKLPTAWNEREALREKGQFWTPAWVAEAMVAYVAQDTKLVFDPAVGRGAFYEALLNLDKQNVSFYGTDIDTNVLSEDVFTRDDCIVEQRDFLKNPPQLQFQAIVGNPPYIRHHRIEGAMKSFLKQLTLSITGFTIDGRAGYHVYFLLQALKHLEKNGRLAFIMPADTCEGTFARKLWQWITKHYCLEAVITFGEHATPFPNVDTNALVFLIKNAKPIEDFYWVKSKEAYSSDLLKFVSSKLKKHRFETLEIVNRKLNEGLNTGFSRPPQNGFTCKYHLHDFATVVRGIATGANEFFFLTLQQVNELKLPQEVLKRAVGRTRDAEGDTFTTDDLTELENLNRPTYLLALNSHSKLSKPLLAYIALGEELGLPERPLIQQRRPWYKMETREVPPLLFAYLGRRNTRFIKNEAGVLPLTGFLCVYPLHNDHEFTHNLWNSTLR